MRADTYAHRDWTSLICVGTWMSYVGDCSRHLSRQEYDARVEVLYLQLLAVKLCLPSTDARSGHRTGRTRVFAWSQSEWCSWNANLLLWLFRVEIVRLCYRRPSGLWAMRMYLCLCTQSPTGSITSDHKKLLRVILLCSVCGMQTYRTLSRSTSIPWSDLIELLNKFLNISSEQYP